MKSFNIVLNEIEYYDLVRMLDYLQDVVETPRNLQLVKDVYKKILLNRKEITD